MSLCHPSPHWLALPSERIPRGGSASAPSPPSTKVLSKPVDIDYQKVVEAALNNSGPSSFKAFHESLGDWDVVIKGKSGDREAWDGEGERVIDFVHPLKQR